MGSILCLVHLNTNLMSMIAATCSLSTLPAIFVILTILGPSTPHCTQAQLNPSFFRFWCQSCEKRHQVLSHLLYCKQWKAGQDLGMWLLQNDFMLRFSKVVSPIQMLQCKKLESYCIKLTCQKRVGHSGLELQNSSSLIEGWGGLLRIQMKD